LVQASMFAVSPDLANMFCELEAVPNDSSLVNLGEDSVEMFADAGTERMPLATTLRAMQQWQPIKPQARE